VADLAAGVGQSAIGEWAIPGSIPARRRSWANRLAPDTIGRRIVGSIVAAYTLAAPSWRRPKPDRPARHHYQRREGFVEDAAMSREMFRL
jgi:hypothetical protein